MISSQCTAINSAIVPTYTIEHVRNGFARFDAKIQKRRKFQLKPTIENGEIYTSAKETTYEIVRLIATVQRIYASRTSEYRSAAILKRWNTGCITAKAYRDAFESFDCDSTVSGRSEITNVSETWRFSDWAVSRKWAACEELFLNDVLIQVEIRIKSFWTALNQSSPNYLMWQKDILSSYLF